MTSPTVRYEFPPTEAISACPWPAYEELRQERPVYRAPGGEYVVSRYDDVRAILKDTEAFLSPSRTNHPVRHVTETDGEEHRRRRLLLAPIIAPGRLKSFEPTIRAFADELIDGMLSDGECDFVNRFAYPFPALVIPELLGLGRDDYDWFVAWAHGMEGAAIDYVDEERHDRQLNGWDYLFAYAKRQLQARVDEPRDDLLSRLLDAQAEQLGGEPDVDALTADAGAVIGGGMHTTAAMLGSTMDVLLAQPGLLERVRADRSLILRVVEEVLRTESPVQWQPRVTSRDVEVAGTEIPAGSRMILLFGSANRDGHEFECPAEFDANRSNVRRHLGLGFGPHTCLGAPLARLEGRIAFEAILDRVGSLRLADRPDARVPHIHPEHRGLDHLWIELEEAS